MPSSILPESMIWDQSFAPRKPFPSIIREPVESSSMNNIHNLLPSDDDLYDIDHFLGLSAHEDHDTGTEKELKIDGSRITNLVRTNRELKVSENFSVNPLPRTKIVVEECGICSSFRRHNQSCQPQFSGCQLCGASCNALQGHRDYWNEPASIPLFCPPNCTTIPNYILPPLYHNPVNPVLPHNIYYPYNPFPPGTDLGVARYNYKVPIMPPTENFSDRKRNMRANGTDAKNQFEIRVERVVCGDDSRTTLMIKNIPNRYTSEMLLETIDENHRGTYDFIYLPIDFKNKCNVGYAFINLTQPQHIIPFYKTFNGKKWGRFSSQKVASLTYARIQGKAALISHFQNSSLMNEDKPYQPILFYSDGPNAGKQEPFPMCTN